MTNYTNPQRYTFQEVEFGKGRSIKDNAMLEPSLKSYSGGGEYPLIRRISWGWEWIWTNEVAIVINAYRNHEHVDLSDKSLTVYRPENMCEFEKQAFEDALKDAFLDGYIYEDGYANDAH